ncbi:hypothetical protein C8R44DRAFT_861385, partial [Mycena epipterygia]
MPFFDHSSGFQILGGNFFEVSGDVHVQHIDRPLSTRFVHKHPTQKSDVLVSHVEAVVGCGHRETSGFARNPRRGITARTVPYNIPSRAAFSARDPADTTGTSAPFESNIPRDKVTHPHPGGTNYVVQNTPANVL